MMPESLPPRMQGRHKPDLGPEGLRVGRNPLERLGGGAEQEVVDDPRVLQGDGPEARWQGEDDGEVLHGQQFGWAGRQPLGLGQGPALGAVPGVARVGAGSRPRSSSTMVRWPHWSHSSTCPPRAAVRQASS
jgi:hypothetical protein